MFKNIVLFKNIVYLTKDQNFNPYRKVLHNSRLLFSFLDGRFTIILNITLGCKRKVHEFIFFSRLSSRSGQSLLLSGQSRAVTIHVTIKCDTTEEHPKYR